MKIHFSIKYFTQWWDCFVILNSKTCDTFLYSLSPIPILVASFGFDIESLFNKWITKDMIEVKMGVKLVLDGESLALNKSSYCLFFMRKPRTAVNDYGFIGLVP